MATDDLVTLGLEMTEEVNQADEEPEMKKDEEIKRFPSAPTGFAGGSNVDVEPLEIGFRLLVLGMDEIDTSREQFLAQIFVECLWESEEDWDRWIEHVNKLTSASKILRREWEHSMALSNFQMTMEKECHKMYQESVRAACCLSNHLGRRTNWRPVWAPRVQFPNAFNRVDDKSWKDGVHCMTCIEGKKYVVHRQQFTAYFNEPLELESFPFDSQDFGIFAMCLHLPEKVRLTPHFFMPTVQIIGDGFDTIPEWNIVTSGTKEGRDWRISTYRHDFTAFLVQIKGIRKRGFYFINVLLVQFLLVWIPLFSFCVPQEEIQDRFALVFTMLLAAVAHQIVTEKYVPIINYPTWLTYYIYGSFGLQILLISAIAWVGENENHENWIMREKNVIIGWALIALLFYLCMALRAYALVLRERKKFGQVNAGWLEDQNFASLRGNNRRSSSVVERKRFLNGDSANANKQDEKKSKRLYTMFTDTDFSNSSMQSPRSDLGAECPDP